MSTPTAPHALGGLHAEIQRRRDELRTLEAAAALLAGVSAPVGPHVVTPAEAAPAKLAARRPRAGAAVDEAIEADVLEALGKLARPAKAREVAERIPGAAIGAVVTALRALAKRKAIVKLGATISLRYALKEFAHVSDQSE